MHYEKEYFLTRLLHADIQEVDLTQHNVNSSALHGWTRPTLGEIGSCPAACTFAFGRNSRKS